MRIEGRIKQPDVSSANGMGYWPAFWALGDAYRNNWWNWPGIGEIDILENVNGRESVFTTLHCGTSPGGPCNETVGLGSGEKPCPGCKTSFHTYAVEYDRSTSPEELRWYLDGTQIHRITSTAVDATTWNNALHHGFFVLLNVSIGGGFPDAFGGGPNAATVSGQPMLIDYVAVYTRGGGNPNPNPSPTPDPTGSRNAFSQIEAESFNAQSGTQTEGCTDSSGCGSNVGWIANGDWLRYDGVDFGSGGASQFRARVASGAGSGVSGLVQVHLDSLNNPSIGSFSIGSTGGWQSWTTTPANISRTTGVHTVYLRFVSGQGSDFVNVNWFTFAS
jgi:beta-glucanase (GH16 family)